MVSSPQLGGRKKGTKCARSRHCARINSRVLEIEKLGGKIDSAGFEINSGAHKINPEGENDYPWLVKIDWPASDDYRLTRQINPADQNDYLVTVKIN